MGWRGAVAALWHLCRGAHSAPRSGPEPIHALLDPLLTLVVGVLQRAKLADPARDLAGNELQTGDVVGVWTHKQVNVLCGADDSVQVQRDPSNQYRVNVMLCKRAEQIQTACAVHVVSPYEKVTSRRYSMGQPR